MNDFDQWFEGLLAELKRLSTANWGADHQATTAMTTSVERAIRKHSKAVDPKLRPSFYDQAKVRLGQLIEQNDEHAGTLRIALDLLKFRE